MMEIHKIEKESLYDWWPHMRGFLDAALNKYGVNERFPLDHVLLDLCFGKSQAWVIVDGEKVLSVTVTEIEKYPLGDVLIIFLMGGESMEGWGDLLHDAMVAHAKEVGALWIDTGSRRGIGKLFYDRLGYTRKYETYTFQVNHE